MSNTLSEIVKSYRESKHSKQEPAETTDNLNRPVRSGDNVCWNY